MAPSPVVTPRDGYLEETYLTDEYLDGAVDYAYGFQALMIVKQETAYGQQAEMVIEDSAVYGQQSEMVIEAEHAIGQQADMITAATPPYGMSAEMAIGDSPETSMQAEMVIETEKLVSQQAEMIAHFNRLCGQQVEMLIEDRLLATGMSAKADTLRHALCEYYLEEAYLVGPYLTTCMHAFLGMQAEMQIASQPAYGQQAEMVIEEERHVGQQAEMIVFDETPYGFQAQLTQVARYGMSATMVIYNNTQLRIMCEFPSRGTPALGGNNWTASNQASGDFLPANINTDVEEQVFRSLASSVDLTCDTGVVQGVTIDTIGIINHNLTRDASVQVQGSMSPTFATINVSFNMVVEEERMYYIAPTFPTGIANQNRYWRFVINDATNPDGYIQIGIIVFGNADIFSVHETFDNPIQRGFKHFKDALPTEGFTAVHNDRALRRFLKLKFTDQERINGNFKLVEDYVQFARTSLKCLIIPIPLYPSRYAVFAKLVTMPEFAIRNVSAVDDPDGRAEYVDYNLDWDESQ